MTNSCGQDCSGVKQAREPAFWAPALILGVTLTVLLWVGIRAINLSHYNIYIFGYGQPAVVVGGLSLFFALYVREVSLATGTVVSLSTALLCWIVVQAINFSHYDIYILGYGPAIVVGLGVVTSAALCSRFFA